jgi:hypothetical protein
MEDPGAAFNLRKFPPDQRERFVNAVTRQESNAAMGGFLQAGSTPGLMGLCHGGRAVTRWLHLSCLIRALARKVVADVIVDRIKRLACCSRHSNPRQWPTREMTWFEVKDLF